MEERTGRCLCGAVTVTATFRSDRLQACHCGQCRTWTGGGPLIVADTARPRFEGEESIAFYRHSAWGERAFCRICGTTLFWREQGAEADELAVGLFPDQSGLVLREEIFFDRKPDWLTFDAETNRMTEAETIAAHAPSAPSDDPAKGA